MIHSFKCIPVILLLLLPALILAKPVVAAVAAVAVVAAVAFVLFGLELNVQ